MNPSIDPFRSSPVTYDEYVIKRANLIFSRLHNQLII